MLTIGLTLCSVDVLTIGLTGGFLVIYIWLCCDNLGFYRIFIPKTIYSINNEKVKMAMFPVGFINGEQPGGGHCNAAIVYFDQKVVERIDPNGSVIQGSMTDFKHFDTVFKHIINNVFPGFTFRSVKETSPYLGPHSKETRTGPGGYCVPWSTYIMHMKALNPNYSTFDINSRIIRKSGEELHILIEKYITYIITEIKKKYPHLVK